MADVKIPESVPCKFDAKGWCPCRKPSTNGWCSKHEGLGCYSCGKQATWKCDAQMGGLGCGAPLCDDCCHAPEGDGHVSITTAQEFYIREQDQHLATVLSRTNPVQRMSQELGVPMNLAELLKGDLSEWLLVEYYFLELEHGLMGFFPAILAGTKRIIITTNKELSTRVWRTLSPRRANLRNGVGYFNSERSLVYPRLGESDYDKESSHPQLVLTEDEFARLTEGGSKPFVWAPGLISNDISEEEFHATIDAVAAECGLSVTPS